MWYGLLLLLVTAWKRYQRIPLNSAGVARWTGSAALALLSMVIVGWPVVDTERDLADLHPIYLPTENAAAAMFLGALSEFGAADDTPVPSPWKVAFYGLTIVSWTLVWYAALSLLLRGIKRIRYRSG